VGGVDAEVAHQEGQAAGSLIRAIRTLLTLHHQGDTPLGPGYGKPPGDAERQ
jgi:hypothetical protein